MRFYRNAARQIRAVSGFQRVMISRFVDDGAGEVLAESLPNGMASFPGLRYPALYITVKVRALNLRNPLSLIADVDAAPSALLPTAAGSVEPLDLSLAMARVASPEHINYSKVQVPGCPCRSRSSSMGNCGD